MTGPYKYVRHPIYSGIILVILGIAIYLGNIAGLLLFLAFFFGAYYKAIKEEKLLLKHFSEKYIEYKKHVRVLIPFVF
ncbi:MAG: isoprenylcysteine carboxylmethyltransferase family protein [Candidatus Taylorbacteria bacterium]|nr:isoprenylcysteine carboxylmethyltransferase family protein [Candidatus Taylorbacteria bacterium]